MGSHSSTRRSEYLSILRWATATVPSKHMPKGPPRPETHDPPNHSDRGVAVAQQLTRARHPPLGHPLPKSDSDVLTKVPAKTRWPHRRNCCDIGHAQIVTEVLIDVTPHSLKTLIAIEGVDTCRALVVLPSETAVIEVPFDDCCRNTGSEIYEREAVLLNDVARLNRHTVPPARCVFHEGVELIVLTGWIYMHRQRIQKLGVEPPP